MISTFINTAIITGIEPSASSFMDSSMMDFQGLIDEARAQVVNFLKQQRKKIRLYCIPFSLDSQTLSGNYTGVKSLEDTIERLIWVVNVTAGSGGFQLQGTNDETLETWNNVGSINVTATGTTTLYFDDPYKYYRVNYTGSSVTYTSYLIEKSFYYAHLYKSLQIIYNSFFMQKGDAFDIKRQYYKELYDAEIGSMAATYDEDDDGVVDDSETVRVGQVIFSR